uniref:Uncharacterized protein n=1 Tax=Alexandrium monilatum TaxID=311494 RepID=A0A7S4PUN5_9DINO
MAAMDQMDPANYDPVGHGGVDRRSTYQRRLQTLCTGKPPPPSLVRRLLSRLERHWYGTDEMPPWEEDGLAGAVYKTRGYLRRRAPNEIEAVLTTIDDKALDMVSQTFTSPLSLPQFAEAIVKTGTYDADHVLAFVGGVIDLFQEVLMSQAENATEDQEARTVNWCQLMNHFIESPEIAMYESHEVTMGLAAKSTDAMEKQVHKNSFVDRAKHMGSAIEKLYWIPSLDMMSTVEGTESVYLWSTTVAQDVGKALTPELPQETFHDKVGKPLFKVLAMDWDPDLQDLAALLSNRMLIVWRLRNKEKGQFQQKRELRFDAKRGEARGDKEPDWKVFLNILDPRTMENTQIKKPQDDEDKGEGGMRRELREQRLADEASTQLDIWFNYNLQLWVTSDSRGRMSMWDLRKIEGTWLEATLQPTRRLQAHTRLVTSHLELSKHKFTTTSLDRSVLLWDNRSLATPEMTITDPVGAVLSQAYLPLYNMLVGVGCEKTVYCWTIDSTAYRGVRKKLGGHQCNLQQVTGGHSVFLTLDESYIMILWDGLTLVQLQTISCKESAPRHVRTLPQLGKVCIAGRRLSFYEGNEHAAIAVGAPPTKDFVHRAKIKQEEGASLKERAGVKWVGLAAHRGTVLSVTEVEVRLHTRGRPEQFRTLFQTPEGDAISDIAVSDRMSLVVLGTAKGAIHFLKYRSGCALKVYPGRTEDLERRWQGAGAAKAKAANDADDEAGADGDEKNRTAGRTRLRSEVLASTDDGRTKSPAAGSRSPAGKAASTAASPQAAKAATGGGPSAEGGGEGAPAEEDGREAENPLARGPASRGGPLLANAPTQEELARGLSRKIKCVLPCEDEKRVYVGTVEGQVIIFRCDSRLEFPVERWATCPDLSSAEPLPGNARVDAPAVTCLHCVPRACVATTTEEEAGLLLVGTQDGVVHLYNMVNLKLAGSVNIPRALPSEEDTTQRGERICHLRLFRDLRAEPGLPLTLLTVDAHSQLRLWGFKIHVQEWKLITLKLILDAGQLMECHCVGGTPQEAGKAAKPKTTRSSKSSQEAASGEAAAAGEAGPRKGKEPEGGAGQQVEERQVSGAPVRITAIATLPTELVKPTKALKKQPSDGPRSAAEAQVKQRKGEVLRMGMEANGKPLPPEEASKKAKGSALQASSAFITQTPGSTGQRTPKVGDFHVSFKEEDMIKEGHREVSGSETEGDSDGLVGRRLLDRPKSPPRLVNCPAGAEEEEAAEAEHANLLATAAAYAAEGLTDGRQLVWMADSGGWIWCIDVAASIEGALANSPPIAVNLQPVYKESTRPRTILRRASMRPALSSASLPNLIVPAPSRDDGRGLLMTKGPLKPHPEVIRVVGAWPAHPEEIVSLAPLAAPPALVSTDISKEVKVWSSAGDLWGHFSMRGVEGAPPVVAVWPPPHVLASQITLMKTAKGLCKKMGFATRKDKGRRNRPLRRQASKTTVRGEPQGSVAAKERWNGGGNSAGQRRKEQAAASSARPSEGPGPSPARGRHTAIGIAGSPASGLATEELRERIDSTCTLLSSATESADAFGETAAASASAADETNTEQPEPLTAVASASATDETNTEQPEPLASPTSVAGASDLEAAASPSHAGEQKKRTKAFTTGQMGEMIRNRAFSSGFQNYKQFARKADRVRSEALWRARTGFMSQEEAERKNFLTRPPSAFGVEIFGERDANAWESSIRGLGHKSSSEGALLRYAHSAVQTEAKWVREALGVDISEVTRRQIRSPDFLTRLDRWPVSADPASPLSATALAVKRLNGETAQSGQKSGAPATPPLVSAGAMTMGPRARGGRRIP